MVLNELFETSNRNLNSWNITFKTWFITENKIKRFENVLNQIWQLFNLACAVYLCEFLHVKKCLIPNDDFKSHSYFVSLNYFPMCFISIAYTFRGKDAA